MGEEIKHLCNICQDGQNCSDMTAHAKDWNT